MPENKAYWKGFVYSAYHGTDEFGDPIYRDVIVYHCSNCGRRTVIQENYCPTCGEKMKKNKKNNKGAI